MAERTGASERSRPVGWGWWLLWVLASVVGWGVGGVMSVPVALLVGTALGTSVGWAVAGAVAGAVVGVWQWLVLRRQTVRASWWIVASTAGWAVAAFVYIPVILGTVLGFGPFVAGAFTWVVCGAVVGICQWLVLRRQCNRAAWLIVASVVGCTVGAYMVVFARYGGGPVFLDALESWVIETTRVASSGMGEGVPVVTLVEFMFEWTAAGVMCAATTGAALALLLRKQAGRRWDATAGRSENGQDRSGGGVPGGWPVWLWWVIASALAWLIGGALFYPVAIVTFLFTVLPFGLVGIASRTVLAILCGAVAGAVCGTLVGSGQVLVLRRQSARTGGWIVASVVGWAVAGSLLLSGSVENEVALLAEARYVAGAWVVGGVVTGASQWLVLRRQFALASWWIVANTAGWAVGAAVVVVGGVVGGVDGPVLLPLAAIGWVVGAVSGGGVTGVVLVWLLRQRVVDSDEAGREAAGSEVMGDRDSGYASAG